MPSKAGTELAAVQIDDYWGGDRQHQARELFPNGGGASRAGAGVDTMNWSGFGSAIACSIGTAD
jgi:hypothetical protein